MPYVIMATASYVLRFEQGCSHPAMLLARCFLSRGVCLKRQTFSQQTWPHTQV
jgi:hypothetical protein